MISGTICSILQFNEEAFEVMSILKLKSTCPKSVYLTYKFTLLWSSYLCNQNEHSSYALTFIVAYAATETYS